MNQRELEKEFGLLTKCFNRLKDESVKLNNELTQLRQQNASLTQQLAESEASREKLRNCIEIIGSQNHNLECPNCSVCEAV